LGGPVVPRSLELARRAACGRPLVEARQQGTRATVVVADARGTRLGRDLARELLHGILSLEQIFDEFDAELLVRGAVDEFRRLITHEGAVERRVDLALCLIAAP